MKERMTEGLIHNLEELIKPVVVGEGMELVDLQFRRERQGWVLRIFIDKQGGVNLDDCAEISRQVGTLLDVKDIIEHSYLLEVSSPGLDRPLKKEEDFKRYIGKKVAIELQEAVEGRKRISGRLLGMENGIVSLEHERGRIDLPFLLIKRARLCYEF